MRKKVDNMKKAIIAQFLFFIVLYVAFTHLNITRDKASPPHSVKNSFRPLKFSQNKSREFDYEKKMEKLIEARVDQQDTQLIQLIRDYYIIPPSEEPYKLVNPNAIDYSSGQTPIIDSRLNYKENGFYVECGAYDGETSSNTLFFEKTRHWNGILIEADPNHFKVLKSKHRKSFLLNACLNTEPYPKKKTFHMGGQRSRIAESKQQQKWIDAQGMQRTNVTVLCFPLYSILRAMEQLNVDFFSLDIEGDELSVLKTIPWDNVNINMMTVEFKHEKEGVDGLRQYLIGKDYMYMNIVDWDAVFKKKNI